MAKPQTAECNGITVAIEKSVKEVKRGDEMIKRNIIKVSQKDMNKVRDSFGCTKEVRDIVKATDLAIDELGAELSGKETLATGMDTVVKLGVGNGSVAITRTKQVTYRNPATGEKDTKYGAPSKQVTTKMPTVFKTDEWQKQIEKRYSK